MRPSYRTIAHLVDRIDALLLQSTRRAKTLRAVPTTVKTSLFTGALSNRVHLELFQVQVGNAIMKLLKH
jgi:hypothetical protein